MSSSARKPPSVPPVTEDRREKLLRDLKLALVDQQVQVEGAGFNPYDALQGRGRAESWSRRRR